MSGTTDRLDGPLLRLMGVMVLGGMMSYLDATVVNVGVETLVGEFQTTLSTIGWVATGYLLAVAVAIPIAGWAVERFGAKRMWLLGLSVFLLGSVLSALAWNAESLILFRVVQGLGGGMVDPIMMAVVARAAGPTRMGRAMGLISVPITLGPVLGPVIGGVILRNLTWEWMFLINVPIALLAIFAAIVAIPADERNPQPAKLDVVGVLLLPPGFAVLVFALSRAGTQGFASSTVLFSLGVGAVLLAFYAFHALQPGVTPLIDLRLFSNKPFSAALTVMTLLGGALFSLMFLLPLYYQQVRGHDVLEAGLLLMPLGLGTLVGMPVAGHLADRIGAKALVPSGAALLLLGAVVYSQADAGTPQVLLTGVQILAGFGMGLVGAPTMGALFRVVAPEKIPAATGAVFILNQLGASLGVAITALLLQNGAVGARASDEAFRHAFWWAAVAALIVLVAGLVLPGRPAPAPAETEAAVDVEPEPAA